ncbi:MAG: tRNA pseudouridine(38-40) synthase TruA [Alphaproteobacteria bacterium]
MRYKITIEYDGTSLLGWQEQLDGPSVQDYLQKALNCFTPVNDTDTCSLNNKEKSEEDFPIQELYEEAGTGRRLQKTDKIIVSGAGRTDAGVHATAQVAHFDLKEDLVDWKLREAINARLREMEAPVSVIAVEKVGNDFHARFSARGRGYLYRILNRRAPAVLEKNRVWWVPVPLDVEKMREGAGYLIGHHDFSSFRAAACQAKSPVKTLDRLDIEVRGEEIHFIVEARSFLHHQVRNMVGTLKMVGDGHLHPEDVKRILEAKNRAAAGVNAPACGLYLTKVVY